jgi:hypothetical protein
MAGASYRNLMRALAQAQARYAEEQAEVQRRYDTQCAAAAATAHQARAASAATAAGVRAAAGIVDHVDTEAARLWQALRHQVPSRLRRRLGVPPEPASPEDLVEPPPAADPDEGQPTEPGPVRHLAEAAAVVARARKRGQLSFGGYTLLPLLGAIAAALAFAAARGLLLLGNTLHGPPGTVVTAVGQIATFAAPLAGLPVAKAYADRRGARVDAGAIGLVVIGGMLVVGALSFLRPPL